MDMEVRTLVVGTYETNCYQLIEGADVLVIDPGASARKLIELIADANLKAILLTHGHFDHTGAVDKLYRHFHCPVYACKNDEMLLRTNILRGFAGEDSALESPLSWLAGNDLNIGPFKIKVYFTPGHSAGSVMYEIERKLFSGDTLFYESVGRTDLFSGSFSQLKQSLEIIKDLPSEMMVYPGHGSLTTIGHELLFNPFIR